MKSALFVDFDNVYTQLRQLQPAAAERFARQPIERMRWMTEQLAVPADHHTPDARRRLLVRRCYLNPNWYQTYPDFLTFQWITCELSASSAATH